MTSSNLSCTHFPKYIRLTIDVGLHDLGYFELCRNCHSKEKPKFVINEKIL